MTNNHLNVMAELDPTKDKGRNSANCATPDEQTSKRKVSTKLQRIIDILKTQQEGGA